jgi:hypothetical protein
MESDGNLRMKFLQGLVYWLGMACASFFIMRAMPSASLLTVMAIGALLLAAAVVLHEGGHALAVVCTGARIIHIGAGPVFIERRLHGFRLRLRSPVAGTAGSVMAVPDMARGLRRQMLWIFSGGPLANALAAALCLPLAWPWGQSWRQMLLAEPGDWMLWLAFGALNAALALGNLIPLRGISLTDGLQFLNWWRNAPSVEPHRRVMQAFDQSLRGMTAAELPPDQIAWFETCTDTPPRFFGRYMALRAAQQRGDQAAFAAVLARCEDELQNMLAQERKALQQLWAAFQIEQAFEAICQGTAAPPPIPRALLRNFSPYLSLRLTAAQAWASGDAAGCRRAIEKAERDLRGELDAAARNAEPLLLDRLRQRLKTIE